MKKILFVFAIASLGLVACEENGNNKVAKQSNLEKVSVNTDSESEKFSYSIGMIIGSTLKNNQVDSIDYSVVNRAFDDSQNDQMAYTLISREVQSLLGEEVNMDNVDQTIIKRAIKDVLHEDSTLLSMQEVNTSYRTFMQNNQTKIGERNLAEGKEYLEANKAKENIQVTESGLQHRLIEEGAGEMPSNNDVVEVSFSGTNLAGDEFINTANGQPAYIDLSDENADIPGLMEGLRLYPAGSQFELFLPSNLAFGNNRMSPEVGPNSTVIIKVDSVNILEPAAKNEYRQAREQYMRQMEELQRQQQGR